MKLRGFFNEGKRELKGRNTLDQLIFEVQITCYFVAPRNLMILVSGVLFFSLVFENYLS